MTRDKLRVGAFFVFSGTAHLTFARRFFERIVPPWLPASPQLINRAAGVAEVTGGALALVPGAERPARRYLIALLWAVFPANIHMALRPEDSGSGKIPQWALWARLPLQFVMMAWVARSLPARSVGTD
ncbi:MAG TPA: hypothetical protein VG223_09175 [Solirubrobacteraceae bacterium]|jgi:uncharacterized membrane protein|nr:hypothetical protein [Solirubrobacteraceae bacterium]